MSGLDHFESLAEQLVEGTFKRLFPPPVHLSELARLLGRAMEDGRITEADGRLLFPNRFWVSLHPEDFRALNADADTLRGGLLRCLQRLAEGEGGRFGGVLNLTLHPRADVAAGRVVVQAAHVPAGESGGDTHEVHP